MRAKRFVVATATAALVVAGTIVSAAPASALSCPTVNPDHTVDIPADVTWSGCTLDGAILDGLVIPTEVVGSSFVGASLRGVTFKGPVYSSQDAVTDLTDADLTGADLSGQSVLDARLDGAEFSGAQLAGAVVAYVHVDGTKFAGAHLAGGVVTISDGIPATLPPLWKRVGLVPNGPGVTAVLAGPGAQLSRVPLTNPDFRGASLAGADLSLSDLTGGIFDGVDLTGADFRHSWLYSNDFTGALNFGKAFWDGAYQMDSICPDGVIITKHDGGGDCTKPIDVKAPTVSLPGGNVWLLKDKASWPVVVTETGSGIADMDARWRTRTAGRASFPSWTTYGWGTVGPTEPWRVENLSMGDRYCVQIRARDRAGNVGAWSNERCAEVPFNENDPEGVYTSWSEKTATWAFGGTYRLTRTKGASLRIDRSVRIRTVGVLASTCPDCGSVAVYVGSRKLGTISLARSTTTTQKVVLLPRLSSALTGTLRLVVTSATGKTVRLDGLVMSAA